MRGKSDPQSILFVAAIDLDQRIRADHPLRAIKRMVDDDLRETDRRFDAAYSDEGRPSIPPERLIKAMLLKSLYSIRSDPRICRISQIFSSLVTRPPTIHSTI